MKLNLHKNECINTLILPKKYIGLLMDDEKLDFNRILPPPEELTIPFATKKASHNNRIMAYICGGRLLDLEDFHKALEAPVNRFAASVILCEPFDPNNTELMEYLDNEAYPAFIDLCVHEKVNAIVLYEEGRRLLSNIINYGSATETEWKWKNWRTPRNPVLESMTMLPARANEEERIKLVFKTPSNPPKLLDALRSHDVPFVFSTSGSSNIFTTNKWLPGSAKEQIM